MLRIVQTVGINKMSILTAYGLYPAVHFINKGRNASADKFGKHLAGIAGRMYHC